MSLLEKAKRALEMAPVAVQALELVNDIRTGAFPAISTKSATDILEIIYAIAEKVIMEEKVPVRAGVNRFSVRPSGGMITRLSPSGPYSGAQLPPMSK